VTIKNERNLSLNYDNLRDNIINEVDSSFEKTGNLDKSLINKGILEY